jgi:TetR/AcrR family tetracycline transcriptional repressor
VPPPARRQLTREGIVAAAIEYVDERGLGALTMRQLGQVLGVEAMSLYHHVNGREDLLEGIVATLVDQVRVPPYEDLGPADGWQGFIQEVAHAVRRLAVDHPNIFPLVATRPPAAPWLRPPMRSLELVEDFLEGLSRRGLSDADAVHVYKVFTSFLLGHLLLEVSARGGVPVALEGSTDGGGATGPTSEQSVDLADYPTLVRLEERLRRHDPEGEFEAALEALLDRLDGELPG